MHPGPSFRGLLTSGPTGYPRMASGGNGRSSGAGGAASCNPASSHAAEYRSGKMTGIRWRMGLTNSFASVVRMAQPSVRARWKATYMVSVGLPVLPGCTAGAGEFAGPAGAKRVQELRVTARQLTLHLVQV